MSSLSQINQIMNIIIQMVQNQYLSDKFISSICVCIIAIIRSKSIIISQSLFDKIELVIFHLSQNPLSQNHRSQAFVFVDTMLDYMIQRGNIQYLVQLFNYCEDSFDIVMNKAADKEWICEYQKQIGVIYE
ncbi:Hypothetical_protein [Hexamita inflata]|uniref:Hypothetical_protein n=1 Tax=Hexamita inflata TaxID=28002 RepID=A0AA86RA63_9EUKA|nr:Hypothetical protein HINF_LOCUS60027 [Hexamita inflata]